MIRNDYCHKKWKCPVCNLTITYYSIWNYKMAVARNMCDVCHFKKRHNGSIIKKKQKNIL